MKKVLWLSRHELTEEQKALLRQFEGEVSITETNIVWSCTKDETRDNAENAEAWKRIASRADIIVGIFPPVSLVGLITARGIATGDEAEADEEWARVLKIQVLTPISEVGTLIVPGKKGKKSFQFLRWQEL